MAAGDTLRRITAQDQWILDATGAVVGLKNPNANGADLRFDPLNNPARATQVTEGVAVDLEIGTPKTVGFAPYQVQLNSAPNVNAGAGTYNRGVWIGFNAARHSAGTGVVNGKPAMVMGFEDNYYDYQGSLKYGPEWYVEYWSPDGTSQQMLRPFYCRVEGSDSNSSSNCTITHDIGSDGTGSFSVYAQGMGTRSYLLNITPTAATIAGTVTFSGIAQTLAVVGNNGVNKDMYLRPGTSSGAVYLTNSASSANNLVVADGGDITTRDGMAFNNFGTSGMKFGGSGTQKIGFYGTTPIIRPTSTPAAATDLATAITLVNALRTALLNLGLVA